MSIEIKKSIKPVNYLDAIKYLEQRVDDVIKNKAKELIWILEHPSTFTAGTSANENDILDKSIDIIKTSRGGKITWHGPGQLIFYFVINLNNKKKDIRKFINIIEKSIITSLKKFEIDSYSDKKNIGIWIKKKDVERKVGAIGIRIKKWIAYHGFSLNVSNDLSMYNRIIPCGIKDKGVTSLKDIGVSNFSNIEKIITKKFLDTFL